MKVLVTAASRHGATAEIADELGKAFAEALHESGVAGEKFVDVRPADQVNSVEDYDAVVLGSAVYMGHWLEPARSLVQREAHALSGRPTWLFSSGPIDDPPKPGEEAVDVSSILEATGARGHRVFAGKLEKGALGFGEKAIALALRAPEGDFRDWKEIWRWAGEIAAVLRAEATVR